MTTAEITPVATEAPTRSAPRRRGGPSGHGPDLRVRHGCTVTALLSRRAELRGVSAVADIVASSVTWSV